MAISPNAERWSGLMKSGSLRASQMRNCFSDRAKTPRFSRTCMPPVSGVMKSLHPGMRNRTLEGLREPETLAPSPWPLPLPRGFECPSQHLAHHRLGQVRPELDPCRHFVGRQLFAAEGAEIGFARGFALPKHHPRVNHFAFQSVGHTGYADLGDCRMRRQHFLDLARPHLVAARLDEIFHPIDDEHIAILVHVTQVARVQPLARGAAFA